ncbi:MAG TPA: hypothetical protein VF439_02250 [Candidatus Paceibacterota bacterium]
MKHHAYVVEGEPEDGIRRALGFAGRELSLSADANPDVIVRRYGLFSVDDARALADIARLSSTQGGAKAVIVSATRLFHEAQNALLKLFEEPPPDTYLFLVVPSAGMLLPTMRSRIMALPEDGPKRNEPRNAEGVAGEFLGAGAAAREKIVAKLLAQAKSDKDEDKQAARADALTLAEGLARSAHAKWLDAKPGGAEEKSLRAYLADLDSFIPILHERSAPLKLIFEHLLLSVPRGL